MPTVVRIYRCFLINASNFIMQPPCEDIEERGIEIYMIIGFAHIKVAGSAHLQLVDVGGMDSAAAEDGGSFTAGIRNKLIILLNPLAVGPVGVVETATTLKLNAHRKP